MKTLLIIVCLIPLASYGQSPVNAAAMQKIAARRADAAERSAKTASATNDPVAYSWTTNATAWEAAVDGAKNLQDLKDLIKRRDRPAIAKDVAKEKADEAKAKPADTGKPIATEAVAVDPAAEPVKGKP